MTRAASDRPLRRMHSCLTAQSLKVLMSAVVPAVLADFHRAAASMPAQIRPLPAARSRGKLRPQDLPLVVPGLAESGVGLGVHDQELAALVRVGGEKAAREAEVRIFEGAGVAVAEVVVAELAEAAAAVARRRARRHFMARSV